MNNSDLLVEIGTEELPPRALLTLSSAFTQNIQRGLKDADLKCGSVHSYASPRRLAVWIEQVDVAQADKNIERRGPAVQAAYDEEGCPTKAASGFARSCGVDVAALEKLETDKGSWLVFRSQQTGQNTPQLLPNIIQTALDKLPIPKRMRWGNLDAQFVRPVQWVVVLFDDRVVDCEILSVKSSNKTFGHRFHANRAITVPHPAEYEVLLESEGKVIADFNRRRQTIRAQIEERAANINAQAVIDERLLDEVTAMVEWPVAVMGNFEQQFLEVPQEALIYTMKTNQKYFHLLDKDNQLLPHFITISNIESKQPEQVREGNERVIRPRFADAKFFWNQDRKTSLESRFDSLKQVVFQKQLGTLHDKTRRLIKLAGWIARQTGADSHQTQRAAMLCKCDLMTDMVGEFPSLQGIMGRYYAQHDGEPAEITVAVDDYYKPRFAGDSLPESKVSQALALAERIDTLTGIFAIGQIPTGVKDPFALRRAALGVLRILIEQNIDLDLQAALKQAASLYPKPVKASKAVQAVLDFCLDRLKAYYQDQDVSSDTLNAVLASGSTVPTDIDNRIRAVSTFRQLPQAESLAAANKRIGNILRKAKTDIPHKVKKTALKEPAEKQLALKLDTLTKEVKQAIKDKHYAQALTRLAELREPVDTFFDNVMVMDDDPDIRNNRLALLNSMQNLFMQIADISRLQD